MGINYYFIRAVYPWPEIKENPTFPVRKDFNQWYLARSWTFAHYLATWIIIICIGKNTSFDVTHPPTCIFQVTWLAQYYTAVDVPQVTFSEKFAFLIIS